MGETLPRVVWEEACFLETKVEVELMVVMEE
jgi:hypothetical protein